MSGALTRREIYSSLAHADGVTELSEKSKSLLGQREPVLFRVAQPENALPGGGKLIHNLPPTLTRSVPQNSQGRPDLNEPPR